MTPRTLTVPQAASRLVAGLSPAAFGFAMATGIVSTALHTTAATVLSDILLWLTVAGAAVLAIAYIWRLWAFRDRLSADFSNPERAFGFLTLVAGLNVLAVRMLLAGQPLAAAAVAAVAAAGWLLLGYGIPARLLLEQHRYDFALSANGTWFMWVVATQSVGISAALLGRTYPATADPLADIAVILWAVGAVLYLMLLGLVTLRLLGATVTAHALSPAHWIYMGATAITTLAGARIVQLPHGLAILRTTLPVVSGLTFVFWSFGTWLIPLLIVFGGWRHLLRREPIAYEATWWSMVFPLGMYSVASSAYGSEQHLSFVTAIGHAEVWIALLAWAGTATAMVLSARHWRAAPVREPVVPDPR
jgi:tellurite resistance protein TehA-like permease